MQTLRVYPNPWAAFDKNGVPCAVCPRDPEADAGGPGRFVGARIDSKHTRVTQDFVKYNERKFSPTVAARIAAQELRSPIQDTYYEYLGVPSLDPELAEKLATKEPVDLPSTKYYKDRIREGSLLAADKETAAKVGVRFTPPAAYFEARRLPKAAQPADGPQAAAPPSNAAAPQGTSETTSSPSTQDAPPTDAKPGKSKKPSQEPAP